MEEKDNELAKQMMLEEVITNAVQIPGVKVNRKQFLAEQFASKAENLEEILDKGPIEAGIKREDIIVLSKKLILARTSQSSASWQGRRNHFAIRRNLHWHCKSPCSAFYHCG